MKIQEVRKILQNFNFFNFLLKLKKFLGWFLFYVYLTTTDIKMERYV